MFIRLLALILCSALPLGAQSIAGTYRGNDIDGLRNAVSKNPDNAGLRLRLSQALLRSDDDSANPDRARVRLKEAQEQFKRVLAINALAPIPLRVMAIQDYMGRRFEESIKHGRSLLAVAPNDSEVARTVLKALIRLKRPEEAAKFMATWVGRPGISPSFGTIQGLISTLIYQDGFRDALNKELDAAIEARPGDVDLRLYRAILYVEWGRSESAWKALQTAESLGLVDVRTGGRHPFVGILDSRTPEFDKAPGSHAGTELEAITKLCAEHPKHAGLAMRKGRLLDLTGRKAEAVAAYQVVAKINPGFWPVFFRLGQLMADDGNHKEAVKMFAKVRAQAPEFSPGLLAEVRSSCFAGELTGAAKILAKDAAKHAPMEETKGIFKEFKDGKMDAALSALADGLRTAVKSQPRNAYLQAHLALALHAQTKSTEAQKVALGAEKVGLAGSDAWPARVLYDVFGVEKPASAGSR